MPFTLPISGFVPVLGHADQVMGLSLLRWSDGLLLVFCRRKGRVLYIWSAKCYNIGGKLPVNFWLRELNFVSVEKINGAWYYADIPKTKG